MDQKTDRSYPSAPQENIDLEQTLEKINDVKYFKNHINNIKEMNNSFENKNNKSKKRLKKL